ncbi:MAG: hypothetical protein ACLFR1_15105 [Spirochaetia bacterium]
MRRTLAILCIFLFIGFLISCKENTISITVINDTGYDIYYLYISPEEDESWGEDILGSNTILENGNRVSINLSSETCNYDIYAIDEDSDDYYIRSINLCDEHSIRLTLEHIDW